MRQEANSEAWNNLVSWIAESIYDINFTDSAISVQRLKYSHREKSLFEIAHVLIVHKSLQAAGVDLLKGIPGAAEVIKGISGYDLPEIAKLSAEMVYQIAYIYGFSLDAPERKIEALTAFGAAFLGEAAIDAGVDWLGYSMIPSKLISASAKALMIYAVGNTACRFYEAKLNQHTNPLNSSDVLKKVRQESQLYLEDATSEEAVTDLISREINTALNIDYTRLSILLKSREWKKADEETCDIILKIANRDLEGSLAILPSSDLHTINQLWSHSSNGHFGFKAQKEIYYSASKQVGDFGEHIGWRGKSGLFGGVLGWKSYDDIKFNLTNAPKGHLPAFPLNLPWHYHKGNATKEFAQSILERNDW
ncbi:GUN4 domain-containing protein [Planktothrix agardhii]|uniref:GUN4 domain-containing protein n=2 Tax=Planktothrix agardhii TaxID=1160 RepID=UPI00345B6A39